MVVLHRIRVGLVASVALLPLGGCMGASNDKGDNPSAGTGTGRPNTIDKSKTGGEGETRADLPMPGPGGTAVRADSPPTPPPR
jgi:hypothetical protein